MVQKTRIIPSEPLKQGEQLVSADGKFSLELSDAVGLIMRDSSGKVLWVLDVRPTWDVDRLDMQSDHKLVLYTKQGKVLWTSTVESNPGWGNEQCVIKGEGELVTSDVRGQLWSSNSVGGLVRAPTDSYLKQQESLLPRDASGAPYRPGTRPGERTEIVPGQPLKKGERLVALNGKYWLELSDEKGFVLHDAAGRALWELGIPPTPVDHLSMQDNKNLVLYSAEGKQVWSAGIHPAGRTGNERCVLEDDGDLVAFSVDGVLWSTGSTQGPGILSSGGVLTKGQPLRSSDSQYTLTVLQTGNLVLKDSKAATVWMTGLVDPTIDRLVMQRDGNLVLLTKDNQRVWDSGTGDSYKGIDGTGKWLRVNTDGTITVAGRGGKSWSSGQTAPGRLNPGQGLPPGSELRSARGRLAVQEDGNVVLYDNLSIARWSSCKSLKPIRGLNLRPDNRLVLYGQDGSELWSFDAPYWRTSNPFELRGLGLFLGDKALLPDQFYDGYKIQKGDRLFSPNNQFQFALEHDGQLTVRSVSDQQLRWSNGVKVQDEAWAYLQDDLNFVEYTHGRAVWATDTGTQRKSGLALGVDDRGVLSVRQPNRNGFIWQVGWPLRLLSGESLKPGEALGSKNGKYVLTFREDGILELAQSGTKSERPQWSSNSEVMYGALFLLQDDGNLLIVNQRTYSRAWAADKYAAPSKYVLTVTDEGELLVSEVGKPEHSWFVP